MKKDAQCSDFTDICYDKFPRNQIVYNLNYFDDTSVSWEEVNLALHLQMAFKEKDISFFIE